MRIRNAAALITLPSVYTQRVSSAYLTLIVLETQKYVLLIIHVSVALATRNVLKTSPLTTRVLTVCAYNAIITRNVQLQVLVYVETITLA